MILELKFTSDGARTMVTQLGATKYTLEVRYNERAGVWALTIGDAVAQTVLLDSLPLVLGVDLLQPYNLGIGSIIVNDEDGNGLDAGPDDLGVRIKAYWISPDD